MKVEIVLKRDQRIGEADRRGGEGDPHQLLLPPPRDQGPARRRPGGAGGEDRGSRGTLFFSETDGAFNILPVFIRHSIALLSRSNDQFAHKYRSVPSGDFTKSKPLVYANSVQVCFGRLGLDTSYCGSKQCALSILKLDSRPFPLIIFSKLNGIDEHFVIFIMFAEPTISYEFVSLVNFFYNTRIT